MATQVESPSTAIPAEQEKGSHMTTKVNLMDKLQESLRHNPHNLTAALETLVDAHGLHAVLLDLAGVCASKSDHVLVNWQDRNLANTWMKAMTICDKAADKAAKLEV